MRRTIVTAALVGLFAFALYDATLLPGMDFGDTGSFQATAGSRAITPRDGYPIYFAIGDLTLWAAGGDPAHAFNLASAIEGGMAVALFTLAAAELSGSTAAGAAAALLFAGSYTFWSQAIIAEVYALHAVFVSLTLVLLLRWQIAPTLVGLTAFFAVYALGFGNHLSMVLLLPGYALFLLIAAPRMWRSVLSPRVVGLAATCAVAGAVQYAWNMHALWDGPFPPRGIVEAFRIFWFDVTKADWRSTMVLRVPESSMSDRLAMYWFDVRQQFGAPAIILSAIGMAYLAATRWRRAVLIALLYGVNVVFAFTYNVGDTHVFYIPSHLILALLASCGISAVVCALRWRQAAPIAAAVVAIYAAARIHRDYPALDRSHDRRPSQVLAALTRGLDDRTDILLTDLNWQIDNGLSYFAKEVQPEVACARMADVLPYLPALVRDNESIGRRVVVTERARDEAVAAYGPLFDIRRDHRVETLDVPAVVARLQPGTRYVLVLLRPTRENSIDRAELERALAVLTGRGNSVRIPSLPYAAIAGLVGERPALVREEREPFDADAEIGGTPVEVRMESWLAADTIRRMGFAQVIANGRHALIAERGVSFAAFGPDGRQIAEAYEAGIFAPQGRYLISFPR